MSNFPCSYIYPFIDIGIHIQRRRENSETSSDGQEKSNFTPDVREGDTATGQAVIPSRAEVEDRGRGFRNQRIPSDAVPKEIPRRQDSQTDIHRGQEPRQGPRPEQKPDGVLDQQEQRPGPRQDHRMDQKQDQRQEQRLDQRQEKRPDLRQDQRSDQRYDHRHDQRPDQRHDQRSDPRQEKRPDLRQDQRPDHRQDQRSDPRQDQRPDLRHDQRPDLRQGQQEQRQVGRQDQRQGSRQEPKQDQRLEHRPSREKIASQGSEDAVVPRQSSQEKSAAPSRVEQKPEVETQGQEKNLGKEAKPLQSENDKQMGPVTDHKENTSEPLKTVKIGPGVDRDRRPQRDSKPLPSSLVDMKSGSRDKFDKNDKADRYDKGRRRDSDRDRSDFHGKDERHNRRGNNEQSGRGAGTRSDSRDSKKVESQPPEPSRAWKGQDTSQRLKLKEPSKPNESSQPEKNTERVEEKQATYVDQKSKAVADERKSEEVPLHKETKDSQNEKVENKDVSEVKGNGAKPKDLVNEKPKAEDSKERPPRDRRDVRDVRDRRDERDMHDRGGRSGGRGRGSADSNRRRDERGPPLRRDDNKGLSSNRRDKARYEVSNRGRGFRPYSTGIRGRGRGRGERYETSSRQGYRRPMRREEEEEWDLSSGDESVERVPERKEPPKQAKPTEPKPLLESTDATPVSAEKPADEVVKPKESEMKEDSAELPNSRGEPDEDRDGTERGNLPRGEPSRRGRGGGALRKGRGGSGGRGASSRGRGRDSYSRDGRDARDDRRPPPSRDGTQRYDSGFRNDSDLRDSYREPRGRGREDEMRQNARDGPPGRGAYRRPRPDRPPRFQKNSHGRGRVRPQRSDQRSDMASSRTKETNDRSQINSGNNSDGASKGASRPPLPRQNSSDLNNDEWETASESSNFNDHKAREKEVASEGQKTTADKVAKDSSGSAPRSNGNPESRPRNNDRRDVGRKGPTTNQRQGADRPGNSHRDSYRSDYGMNYF